MSELRLTIKELCTLDSGDVSFLQITFSPDGRWLASGGDDMAIKLWQMPEGIQVESLMGIKGGCTQLLLVQEENIWPLELMKVLLKSGNMNSKILTIEMKDPCLLVNIYKSKKLVVSNNIGAKGGIECQVLQEI